MSRSICVFNVLGWIWIWNSHKHVLMELGNASGSIQSRICTGLDRFVDVTSTKRVSLSSIHNGTDVFRFSYFLSPVSCEDIQSLPTQVHCSSRSESAKVS